MNRVLIKFSLQRRKIGGRLGKIFRVPKKKHAHLKKKVPLQQLTRILAQLESFHRMDQVLLDTVSLKNS